MGDPFMSVDKIVEKILSDAGEQVRLIEAQVAEQVRQMEREQDGQVKAIEKAAAEEGTRRAEDRHRKDIATAELELRKGILAEKQKLIQDVFEEAFSHLEKMKGEKYLEFLADLLMKTVETGQEEVIFSKDDARHAGQSFIDQINERLKKEGKTGKLRLVGEAREIGGGFVLRWSKKEVNCSLAALFGNKREELEPRVAEILFS
jgi:V/A-type H+-transporting ATPase subunit E